MAKRAASAEIVELGGDVPSNDGQFIIDLSKPYTAAVTIQGSADLLFHRWSADAVEEKSKAAKGSRGKREDDVESYLYRDDDGVICLPGEYLRQAIINAAKYRQDPRSPRKSAMDLFKAGVQSLTPLAPLGATAWDYLDKRRVVVQRNGVNRTRPALKAGWRATFELMVALPEYIPPSDLNDAIGAAGRLVGVGDFRPTYGRFQIVGYTVAQP
jgi:hypothetical protein